MTSLSGPTVTSLSGVYTRVSRIPCCGMCRRIYASLEIRFPKQLCRRPQSASRRTKSVIKAARVCLTAIDVVGCFDPFIWWSGKPVRGIRETQKHDPSLFSPTSARPPPFDSHRDRQNSSQSPNDARVTSFRVAYLPGFVNLFAGKAYLGGGRWANIVPNGNDVCPDRAGSDFTAFLRRVVFVG